MKYLLRSGRELNVAYGIFGLTEDLRLSDGFDGLYNFEENDEPLTPDERGEIAGIMISRWEKWREAQS